MGSKIRKCVCGQGLAQDPAGGWLNSAPPNFLDFRRPKQGGEENSKKRDGKKRKRMGGNRK